MVVEVQPGGPAYTAGILPGDIILGIEDRSIITVSDLQAELFGLEPGTSTELRVLRRDREFSVFVRLAAMRGDIDGTGNDQR